MYDFKKFSSKLRVADLLAPNIKKKKKKNILKKKYINI